MVEAIEQRDFFISFTSADLAFAEAIDVALRAAGFTTYFHPNDIEFGGNIPLWMDNALMNSRQMLALYSPDYVADTAVYSEAERYARFWQDSRGAKFKIVPVELKSTNFTPLLSVYKRLSVIGKTPEQAAAAAVTALKKSDEVQQREVIRSVEPLPKIFNVLYRHNPNFTGRFEAMEALQKSLHEGNAAITAVAGLGGVGKTTLAAEYCHRFGGRYGGVWWVRAEQESVTLSDLAALGQRLGLATTNNIETDARTALENLASHNDSWLMVYDNAPNADAVNRWLPTGGVRCLITSRFTGFDDFATVTRLDQWSDQVTADYLLARTERKDRDGARRLAHALGGLPLAAEQAAAFLKNRKGIEFDDYTEELARLIKEGKPQGATGDYPDTVYAAFGKSLDTLRDMKGGKIALDLLRLCSFLSPDGVDLSLLLTDPNSEILPTDFAVAMADKFRREDALASLSSLSLLRQEEGPIGAVLIFHRLLLEVLRDRMGADADELWGHAALQLLNLAFPDNVGTDPGTWPSCTRLMPHISPLEKNAPRTGEAGKTLDRLLYQAARYLATRGDYVGALAMAAESVRMARLTKDSDPLGLATSLNAVANCYVLLVRDNDAEEVARESLEILEQFPDSTTTLGATLSILATIHLKRKEYALAETFALRALETVKRLYGPNSGIYATVLSNLGVLYAQWARDPEWTSEPENSTRRAKAQECQSEELAITLAARGVRHPETAVSYYNLAVTKASADDWVHAALDAERAWAIMLSLGLSQHPSSIRYRDEFYKFRTRSGQTSRIDRIKNGDIADINNVIREIESEHRAWVAKDNGNRHFGPPSAVA